MYCGGVLPRNSLNYIAAASAIEGFFGGGYAEQFWGFTPNKLGVYAEQTEGLRVGAALRNCEIQTFNVRCCATESGL